MSNPNAAKPVEKKPSATERLTNLEGAAQSLFQLADNLIKDLDSLRKTIQLLNNKVDALAKANIAGEEPNDEVLNRIMIENNIADLSQKVAALVEKGALVSEDVVSDNAFIVGQELDGTDKVLNPRIQFALKALKPDMQAKLLGAKVGDTLLIQENLKFAVLESYSIQQPPAPAPAAEAAPAATTDATPVETAPVQSK